MMPKVHFRLLEGVGMVTVLAAWALNWASVDHWAEAKAAHERAVEEVIDSYHHIQISANIRLEGAIARSAAIGTDAADRALTGQPYQEHWHDGEVRRAWLQRTFNNATGLGLLRDRLAALNSDYHLAPQEKIEALRDSLGPVEGEVMALVNSGPKGYAPFPVLSTESLSSADSERIEVQLATVSENAFALSESIEAAIDSKRPSASWYYTLMFGFGSVLLAMAKFLEWRSDTRSAGHPPLGNASASGNPSMTPANKRMEPTRPGSRKRAAHS